MLKLKQSDMTSRIVKIYCIEDAFAISFLLLVLNVERLQASSNFRWLNLSSGVILWMHAHDHRQLYGVLSRQQL